MSFYVRGDGPVPLIEVGRAIDVSNADLLAGCLSVFGPGDRVIVDLFRLTYIDSTGIDVLAKTCERGVKVIGRGVRGPMQRVLEVSGAATMVAETG